MICIVNTAFVFIGRMLIGQELLIYFFHLYVYPPDLQENIRGTIHKAIVKQLTSLILEIPYQDIVV